MESVDLGEGGDVHWEASIWENYSKHFFLLFVFDFNFGDCLDLCWQLSGN